MRSRQLGRVPAQVDTGRDGGEDGGEAEEVGRQECEVPRHERDRDLRRRVVEPAANLTHDPTDGEPDRDTAHHAEDEAPTRRGRGERAGQHRRHGNAIEDEARAVVHEALALHDRDELARHAEPPRDRGRGERIGRGHDCAEHERGRPREPVDDRVCDDRDPDGRRDDEADRQEPDRPHVRPQVAERREERCAVEKRRQHAEEDELRLGLELRHSGHEADGEPAEHQEDRVGSAERGGEREHGRDRRQQP